MASSVGVVVRRFSTSSLRGQLVQPPLAVFGTEGRYATALYSAASKQKKLDAVEGDIRVFQKLLLDDGKLATFVANPTLKRNLRKSALVDVLTKKKACNLTINTFEVLADNGRFNKINAFINAYLRIMSAHRGEVVCEVISAKPLDEASLKDVTTALQAFLKKGEVIHVSTKVDPSLIGGLVVSIGDKYVDMSFSSKIKAYTSILKGAI